MAARARSLVAEPLLDPSNLPVEIRRLGLLLGAHQSLVCGLDLVQIPAQPACPLKLQVQLPDRLLVLGRRAMRAVP